MGNSKSTQVKAPGGIIITIDEPSYHPGDVVKGNICVNMQQSFSTSQLELTLRVEQLTRFVDSENTRGLENIPEILMNKITDNGQKNKFIKEGNTVLYNSTVIVSTFPNNLLAPGQYQYPFSFTLPLNLPGSFEYYDEFNTAYTEYILDVTLPSTNQSLLVKSSAILIVSQTNQALNIPKQITNNARLRTWGVMDQGYSSLSVSIPRDFFYTDETLIVDCTLDNTHCKLNGKNIKVQLFQEITLRDNIGQGKILQRKISELSYQNLYHKLKINQQTFELPVMDYDNPTIRYLNRCEHKHLFKNGDLVSKLQASVKSALIDCKYTLRVKSYFDGNTVGQRLPIVEMPLAILIPDVRIDVSKLKPLNWNPAIAPINSINFPSASDLGIPTDRQQGSYNNYPSLK